MFDWLTNFTLLRPLWLLALLPGAALWWFLRRNSDPRRLYGRQIAPHLLKHLVIGESKRGLFQPLRIFSLVWLLLVFALAGPSWRMEPAPFAEQQAGLMVLLKTGSSMKTLDLPPSRLERAVHKLHDLFAVRGPEPSGLIAYSGSAHLVMPLTRDTRIIEVMAAELGPSVMPVDGDRLSEALELAHQQFERSQTIGSILVIADSIDAAQSGHLSGFRQKDSAPVQVLAMVPEPQAARAAVAQGAKALGAAVITVTVDDSDVLSIVAGAKRLVADISVHQEGSRRRDGGYLFVPFITALIALWARRGWSLRWP